MTEVFVLVDAENIGNAEMVADGLRHAQGMGRIVRAVAVVGRRAGIELLRVLENAQVAIVPRLPLMPKNAADAMLTYVAQEEAVTRAYGTTDFVFISDDAGYGGCAALLRDKGYRCWRICTRVLPTSHIGFDGVIALRATPIPAPTTEPHVKPVPAMALPAAIFPAGQTRMDLAYFGQRLARHYPKVRNYVRRYGKKFSTGLGVCARTNQWPIRLEMRGPVVEVVRSEALA